MKRLTDANKWSDPWFRRLSCRAKQLWIYLLDHCDNIGLVEVDLSLISSDCGQKIDQSHVAELCDRVQAVNENRLFIPKFIRFQYGELNQSCPPHRTIIKAVELHGLVKSGLDYHYPNATLALGYIKGTSTLNTRQDKIRQDKTVQDNGGKHPTIEECRIQAEKAGLPSSEGDKFFNYHASKGWKIGKTPMVSMPHAMGTWKSNYRGPGNGQQRPATTWEMKTRLDAAEAEANAIKNKHSSETANGRVWDCDSNLDRYRELRGAVKELRTKLALPS